MYTENQASQLGTEMCYITTHVRQMALNERIQIEIQFIIKERKFLILFVVLYLVSVNFIQMNLTT